MKYFALLSIFLAFCAEIGDRGLKICIVSHRGVSLSLIENTSRAIRSSNSFSFDGIEIDVRISKDACLFVHHDKNTGRLMNHDYLISEVNYPVIKGLKYQDGTTMLTLKEAIQLIEPSKRVFVDIKDGYSSDKASIILNYLSDSIDVCQLDRVVITSHDYLYLRDIKEWKSDIITNLIFPDVDHLESKIDLVKKYKIDIVSINHNVVNSSIINQFHDISCEVYCTLIDTKERLFFFSSIFADGIFTDSEELLLYK